MIQNLIKAAYHSAGGKFSEIGSSWMPVGMAGRITPSGAIVDEDTAMSNSAIFASVRCIAETIGSLPKHIIKKKGEGERMIVSDHPSVEIFTREANPCTTSMSFFETIQGHVMTWGNGYAELEMEPGGGRVIRAWILPPDRVTPELVELDDGRIELKYIVRLPDGKQAILPRERILHIPGLGFNGISGYPVVEYASKAIGLSQSLEEFGSSYFAKGQSLTGYVTVPPGMEVKAIKNLRNSMEEMNNGLSNMHRDKFLLEGVSFTPAQKKPEESQMIESRTFQIQEIARFFRIPLHKIGELSKANYNSLEQMQDEFRTDTIVPWAVRWEQEINRKFFIEPKDRKMQVKFNTNALLRGDSTARSAYYRTMVSFGLMTQNEIRALEDLPSHPGGDSLLLPLNMTKMDEEAEAETKENNDDE